MLFKYSTNTLFIQPYQTEAKRSSLAVLKNYGWSNNVIKRVVRLLSNLSFSCIHQITCVVSRNALWIKVDFYKILFAGLEMESWLVDVKRVRIPRPKFASARHGGSGYPTEPPKDYIVGGLDDPRDEKGKRGDFASRELAKATEELRRAVQEKL